MPALTRPTLRPAPPKPISTASSATTFAPASARCKRRRETGIAAADDCDVGPGLALERRRRRRWRSGHFPQAVRERIVLHARGQSLSREPTPLDDRLARAQFPLCPVAGAALDAPCGEPYTSTPASKGHKGVSMSGFHGPDLGPFQWDDPLLLEAQLTEDERMIRDTAREFAAKGARAPRPKGLSRGEDRPQAHPAHGRSGAARGDAAGGIRLQPAPVTSLTDWWRARSSASTPASAR